MDLSLVRPCNFTSNPPCCVVANFRDSKEIMMTSDSEAEYKYSRSYKVPIKAELPTTCPAGELRCVNGNCITISQLCDKVCLYVNHKWIAYGRWLRGHDCQIFFCFLFLVRRCQVTDCPDGADEAMCVYHNWAKHEHESKHPSITLTSNEIHFISFVKRKTHISCSCRPQFMQFRWTSSNLLEEEFKYCHINNLPHTIRH